MLSLRDGYLGSCILSLYSVFKENNAKEKKNTVGEEK